jgi:hypothetical protein
LATEELVGFLDRMRKGGRKDGAGGGEGEGELAEALGVWSDAANALVSPLGGFVSSALKWVASQAVGLKSATAQAGAAGTQATAAGIQASSASVNAGAAALKATAAGVVAGAAAVNAGAAALMVSASVGMIAAGGMMLAAAGIIAAAMAAKGILGLIGLQHGGIVTRPTLSVVGEKGPEAVIPLHRLPDLAGAGAGGGYSPVFNLSVDSLDELSLMRLARRAFDAYNTEAWRANLREPIGEM